MKIAVITAHDSDLPQLLRETDAEVQTLHPNKLEEEKLDFYASFVVLGGGGEVPLLLEPKDRKALEKQINKWKRTFVEYASSIGNVYFHLLRVLDISV
ncbi:hypothetical protein [Alkalihalobacillus sp. TS-13]|uniref:hypothetical protein n=1 Tax=Alkalihalobacillus sp. TS-13 TaxID=2842455 RepID=UPI001C87631E|nr:hypothetical protein [Alkalihalobacillus sp. TS-13]